MYVQVFSEDGEHKEEADAYEVYRRVFHVHTCMSRYETRD